MKKRNKKIINNKINNIYSNQKGMALLTTLIFVFVLVTFAVALLTMTSNDSKLSTLQRESTRAFYLAEMGIDKALWCLNTPEDLGGEDMYSWRPTSDDPFKEPEGTPLEYFEVTIKNVGILFGLDDADRIEITSVGTVEGGQFSTGKRTVVVIAKIGISPSSNLSYDHAILTDGDMTLNGGIFVSGTIHSNGDTTKSGEAFEIVPIDGATASGTSNIDYSTSGADMQDFPEIDWEHFEKLVINPDPDYSDDAYESGNGKYYGKGYAKVFNTDELLNGTHYIDGDVTIQAYLILDNATIFATGTIDVIGSGDVNLINNPQNPLALIAKGDITIGGSVHGEGIIQSESTITINGYVNIEEGALYANDGVLNGGGGRINVVYGSGLAGTIVPGTGVPVWLKTSWREAY